MTNEFLMGCQTGKARAKNTFNHNFVTYKPANIISVAISSLLYVPGEMSRVSNMNKISIIKTSNVLCLDHDVSPQSWLLAIKSYS